MAMFSCFSALLGTKKQKRAAYRAFDTNKEQGTLKVKLQHTVYSNKDMEPARASFTISVPLEMQGKPSCQVQVLGGEDLVVDSDPVETAYDGGDENDYENSSLKRNISDLDPQALVKEIPPSNERTNGSQDLSYAESSCIVNKVEEGLEMLKSGNVSDPGAGKTAFWGSPSLKRSCSNVEARWVLRRAAKQPPLSNSQSLENLDSLEREEIVPVIQGSPLSIITSCSADRVMLRKRSSSQVLPSRSRKLWWKLFLWSHRNLHRPVTNDSRLVSVRKPSNQRDGYASDNVEVGMTVSSGAKELPTDSFPKELRKSNLGKLQSSSSGYGSGNQWLAFHSESSHLGRVDEWVSTLEPQLVDPPLEHGSCKEVDIAETIFYPTSPEKDSLPTRHSKLNVCEDIIQANRIIQSLNSLSPVAHIAGIGLKVIPNISPFSSLRSVNISGNVIAYITPGSLPKGLHTLNLSRNKIATIDGLRELTRLRVLDLSYNRISRIGHGLSNCTIIKELYLSGNKISDVEGLHRLLKLTVLDLSFNKLTTTKGFGQLVANYNSLLALNLLGNPIQSNIGDDHLRKTLSSLLPHLTYLNKQPIRPHRGGEAVTSDVAKAALGNGSWSSRRKQAKRVGQSSLTRGRVVEKGRRTARHRSGSHHHHSPSTRR